MKKLITLCVLLLLVVRSFGGQPEFHVKFSEPLAVFEFVDHLSANAPPNSFKKLYQGASYNNETFNRLVAAYDSLNLDYGFEYTAYPYGQKIGGSTFSMLKRELINSTDLKDFRVRATGIIPNADLQKLTNILNAMEPVYQQLIYQPNKQVFESQLNRLKKLTDSLDLTSYFNAGLKFYNSSWNLDVPFELVFYPLPMAKGFKATVVYNMAISAVPTDLTNYNKLLSVMLHEMFHVEYDEESLAFKKKIEQWFIQNPAKTSRYAYLLLNEALATAMGNGYVYGRLNGLEDSAAWYKRKYTNLMAKKIYPVVKSYILQGKAIDQAFIESYIRLYDDNFKSWILEKDNVLTDRYVLSDNADDFNVTDQYYPYRSMSEYKTPISFSNIEEMKQAPITKVVIVSKNNYKTLLLLKQSFNELKDWQPNSKIDFNYTAWLNDKTYLIIMNEVADNTEKHLKELLVK